MSEDAPIPKPGLEGDTDPATQDWREKNWIPGTGGVSPKALEMAHAEVPGRTDSAEINEAAELVEQEAGKAEYKSQNEVVFDDSLRGQLDDRRKATQKFVEEHGEHPGFAKADTTAADAYRNQTGFSYQGFEVDKMRRIAENKVGEAEQAGYWAGILHEHPISDAYRDAHPDINFHPIELARLAELLAFKKQEAEEYETDDNWGPNRYDDDVSWGSVGLPILFNIYVSDMGPLLPGSAVPEGYKETPEDLAKLLSNSKTTLSELRQWFLQKEKTEIYDEMNKLSSVLEDVKTGRASDPNYRPRREFYDNALAQDPQFRERREARSQESDENAVQAEPAE